MKTGGHKISWLRCDPIQKEAGHFIRYSRTVSASLYAWPQLLMKHTPAMNNPASFCATYEPAAEALAQQH
jgi:hypothetical protein